MGTNARARSRPRIRIALVAGIVSTLVGAFQLNAQELPSQADSLAARVDSLNARLDSLRAELDRIQQEEADQTAEDELEALLAAAEAAAGDVQPEDPDAQEGQFVGRQRSLQSLNPEISVNADFFAFSDPDDPDQNNFVPREVEFSFQSALDPYTRAKIFLAYHTPGGELIPFEGEEGHAHEDEEGAGFGLEEAYMEWVTLPGGVSLKVGKFFQQLGQMNRWHSHALPFQARSLPHLTFIGEESLSQAGASVRSLIPIGGGGTYEAVFEVTRSENAQLYGDSNRPSFLGHLNGFWQLSEAWDLDLGLSATGGPFRAEIEAEEPTDSLDVAPPDDAVHQVSYDQRLYNVEASVTWAPPGRTLYRGFNLRGGLMINAPSGSAALETAMGTWVWGEVRVGRQWLLGGRYEWVENPAAPTETAWLVAPSLTWWQSEWVRLRTELNHIEDPAGARNLFLIQFTFAMGPHKHETY